MTDQSTPASTEAAGLPVVAWRIKHPSEPGMIGHYPWSYSERATKRVMGFDEEPLVRLADAQAAITRAEEAVQPLRDQVARLERELELAKAAPLYSTREDAARWHWWKPWIERRVGDLAPYEEVRRKGETAEDAIKAAPLDVEAARDLTVLREFVGEVMGDWPDVGGLDGFDLQGIGEKAGLLRRETRQAPCGEQCACVEFDSGEVECWRVEPVLQRAREGLRCELTKGAK